MQSPPRRHSRWIPAYWLLVPILGGCGGMNPLEIKEREVDDLRHESERRRDSLIELLSEVDHLRSERAGAEEEKDLALASLAALEASLRHTNEQVAAAEVAREEARTRAAESEKANERLKQGIEKVRSIASASVGELADLRLKREELEARVNELAGSEAALRKENGTLQADAEELRSELVRARAALRSLQDGADQPGGAGAGFAALQREISGLKGENLALQRRIDVLSGRAAEGGAAAPGAGDAGVPAAPPPAADSSSSHAGAVYRDDPAGLFIELGGIFQDRYRKAMRGQIAWDSFDIVVVATSSLVLLLLAGRVTRAFRRRPVVADRVKRVVERGPGASRAESPGAPVREEGARPRRAAPPMRRSTFSAVISQKSPEQGRPERIETQRTMLIEDEPAADDVGDAPGVPGDDSGPDSILKAVEEGMASGPERAGGAAGARPAPEPRRVIGAHVWDEDPALVEDLDDEMAHTQLIPRLTAEEKAADPGTGKSRGDAGDKDLLSELKSVINKKFDELMK